MSQSTTTTSEVTSQYTAQVTSDLERNVTEQERIGAEITALQEQLTALQHDHSVLVNVQQALGMTSAPARLTGTPDGATVPAARRKTPGELGAGKRTRAKKTPGTPGRTTVKKPADKAAATTAGQPTLVELVRSHLAEQGEPRSAADVTTALGAAHPEHGIKTTVVRNTLERLVAKKQAQRVKQGSSVYYTAPDAAEQSATPSHNEAQSEQSE
ncbi:hypothetical protein AAW14_31990 [Streptomyces hygroscopicus]|uniref:hypothetical protein n=1 Tax=Streptomyces hygroscopicus TaxID=1912 RepID=UPI00223F86BD|nr:hypothetical protein [Streptomyces hygroscopicus]MCW7946487.1 hypothetical protein [Streptomyces hygroscopicus]